MFRAIFPCNLWLLQLVESRSFTEAGFLTEEHFEGPIKCTHDVMKTFENRREISL